MRRCFQSQVLLLSVLLAIVLVAPGRSDETQPSFIVQLPSIPRESPADAALRHERVAKRRSGLAIFCHRGALEFAHENTLEAYRATFELGADGNEIDIRATRDGVLVCFHDDMLDRLLEAYGTVRELDWDTLRNIPFREPGKFGEHCRIPTLVEVFELHRKHSGLIHLDIKESGIDTAIAQLLDQMDMWDHIAFCNANGRAIVANPKLKLSRYKAGLYEDRSEVDPSAIAAVLERSGDSVILEDPRGVLVALGRPIGRLTQGPVDPSIRRSATKRLIPSVEELIATLQDAKDWNQVAESFEQQLESGDRIRKRARAAELLLAAHATTPAAFAALEERVRHRSLHKHWMYHGLDGALAVRSLIRLKAPNSVHVARSVLWSDDPEVERVHNPEYKTPRSWTDFRLKMLVFPALATLPGSATESLCRDYLALDDESARMIGPPQFEEAARTLVAISPNTSTALELMRHRLRVVRGRAILACLSQISEPWSRSALEQQAPHALAYVVRNSAKE